jgi:DNA-binding HxlR family transcriptional regulator
MVKRRKSKVAPPPEICPLDECLKLVSGAWTGKVIWYLREGSRCFTELRLDLKGVSAKVLTERLKKMERDGVLRRGVRETSPPTVWYELTQEGRELLEVLEKMVDVGRRLKALKNVSEVR